MKGHLLGDPPRYPAIFRHRDRVPHHSVAGPDDYLLDKRFDEGPALGQLALVQKLVHVLGVGGDGLHVVQHHPPLGQQRPRLLRRGLQPLLPLPVVPDAGLEVLDVHVGGLHQVVEPFQPAPHVGQLRLHRLQLDPLLLGHPVHLLVHQLDQFPDIALGQDVGANLLHHHLLETAGVQPGGVAGPAAPLHQ